MKNEDQAKALGETVNTELVSFIRTYNELMGIANAIRGLTQVWQNPADARLKPLYESYVAHVEQMKLISETMGVTLGDLAQVARDDLAEMYS